MFSDVFGHSGHNIFTWISVCKFQSHIGSEAKCPYVGHRITSESERSFYYVSSVLFQLRGEVSRSISYDKVRLRSVVPAETVPQGAISEMPDRGQTGTTSHFSAQWRGNNANNPGPCAYIINWARVRLSRKRLGPFRRERFEKSRGGFGPRKKKWPRRFIHIKAVPEGFHASAQ